MRTKRSVYIVHAVVWLVLSVVLFFSAEPILQQLLPGVHTITVWLWVTGTGLVLVLLACIVSLIVSLRKVKLVDDTI